MTLKKFIYCWNFSAYSPYYTQFLPRHTFDILLFDIYLSSFSLKYFKYFSQICGVAHAIIWKVSDTLLNYLVYIQPACKSCELVLPRHSDQALFWGLSAAKVCVIVTKNQTIANNEQNGSAKTTKIISGAALPQRLLLHLFMSMTWFLCK